MNLHPHKECLAHCSGLCYLPRLTRSRFPHRSLPHPSEKSPPLVDINSTACCLTPLAEHRTCCFRPSLRAFCCYLWLVQQGTSHCQKTTAEAPSMHARQVVAAVPSLQFSVPGAQPLFYNFPHVYSGNRKHSQCPTLA